MIPSFPRFTSPQQPPAASSPPPFSPALAAAPSVRCSPIAPRGTATAENPPPAAHPSTNCIPSSSRPGCDTHSAPSARCGNDVIDAPRRRRHSPQTVKTAPAFPRMDRFPQRALCQKVGFLQTGHAAQPLRPSLRRLYSPARLALPPANALQSYVLVCLLSAKPQRALGREPPYSPARHPLAEARPTRQPANR